MELLPFDLITQLFKILTIDTMQEKGRGLLKAISTKSLSDIHGSFACKMQELQHPDHILLEAIVYYSC